MNVVHVIFPGWRDRDDAQEQIAGRVTLRAALRLTPVAPLTVLNLALAAALSSTLVLVIGLLR